MNYLPYAMDAKKIMEQWKTRVWLILAKEVKFFHKDANAYIGATLKQNFNNVH